MARKRIAVKKMVGFQAWGPTLGRAALVLASLAALTYGLLDLADTALGSEMFIVEDVSVDGNCMLTDEEIMQALDIPAVVHLWQIEPQVLEMRVMGVPLVRTAKVTRVFPKTLAVSVEERVPLVDLREGSSEKTFAMDEEGIILGEAGDLERRGVQLGVMGMDVGHRPVVTGLAGEGWEAGDHITGERITEVLKALSLAVARNAEWVRSLEEIRAPNDARGWMLRCASISGDILVGETNFVERIGQIAPTAEFLKKERIEVSYVDLRFDDQGILIKPVKCDPDHWVEVAARYPEPVRGRNPV